MPIERFDFFSGDWIFNHRTGWAFFGKKVWSNVEDLSFSLYITISPGDLGINAKTKSVFLVSILIIFMSAILKISVIKGRKIKIKRVSEFQLIHRLKYLIKTNHNFYNLELERIQLKAKKKKINNNIFNSIKKKNK